MKQIAIITMVPTVIHSLIENSILRQAHDNGAVVFQIIDLREYGKGNYHQKVLELMLILGTKE